MEELVEEGGYPVSLVAVVDVAVFIDRGRLQETKLVQMAPYPVLHDFAFFEEAMRILVLHDLVKRLGQQGLVGQDFEIGPIPGDEA